MPDIRTPENPVGTKEQREEIRRCERYSPAQIDAALDGLDIAEKAMLAEMVISWPTKLTDLWYVAYEVAAWRALEKARTEWNKWKGEPE